MDIRRLRAKTAQDRQLLELIDPIAESLGLEVVLAGGRTIRTGSWAHRSGTPFTRYYGPDLTGLFLADTGAMGVKTRAALKLIPLPLSNQAVSFAFDTFELAYAAMAEMARLEDAQGDKGTVSGSLYCGDHDHYAFLGEVFSLFSHANVLQRDMYPSATRFEGEIIAMTLDMLHGGPQACGVLTSGGTESLMNPLLVYREWGRERGITAPNIVMPVTAHPALDKGAHYFGIEVRTAAVTDRFVADMDSVRSMVDANTVALVGSAGSYPHGLIDPIDQLSDLAVERGLNLHVDGCLGGFVLAWGESVGVPVPVFDFRLPGVTSISADTHKYGFGLKGSSVLLYRDPELRRRQYFMKSDWPGGFYTSPGMSGSRSGGIIASAWAAMVTLGREGHRAIAADIFSTDREEVLVASTHSGEMCFSSSLKRSFLSCSSSKTASMMKSQPA